MRILLLGFLLVSFVSFGQKDETTVDQLHRKKFNWLINKNYDSLNQLLHEQVNYIHSNGWVQTKKEVIEDLEDQINHLAFYEQLPVKPDCVICVFGYLGNHNLALTDWNECNKILAANYTGAVSILNVVANDFESKKHGTIVGVSW